ncbi:general secretion pathway protein D [Terrimicrobium sacchariphilum]|uniref:General secretion pathway protein D n=1 Tax=Terrimicrobium sacchariphilum TaxID=690879 RepID=A0A146GDG7_TERSA|nr:Amuc_1098 family type IV pilus outer membrane protein [Terrimicrobium sacchariphilum]GAT35391.1 general secretion pathway protein D [Terrimicrobium sacchariphilum]
MIFQHSTRIARSSLALWVVFTSAFFPVLSRAQQGAVAATADREIVRRQEGLVVADKLIAKGDAAVASKDFETAYLSYMDALALVPPGGATESDHAKILAKFSSAAISYAQWLVTQGRYSDAEKVAKTVLLPEYNPTYKPAAQFLANLEQPDYYNKTITPQSAEDVQKVTRLLNEADGYYQSGRYDLAIRRYEQVLLIDRYNIAARKGMEEVNLQRTKYQTAAYDETRSRLLWLVERSWERPVHGVKDRTTDNVARTRGDVRDTAQITAKLNRIIIPRLDLQDETVQDAVERLKQLSRQQDTSTDDPKAKRGVNIVLKLNPSSPAPAADATAAPAEGAAPTPAPVTADSKITLSLSNVPLIEALRYLTELAGLKFKIEQYAVSIVPLSENIDDLVTKEYRVPAGFIPASAGSSDSTPSAGRIAANVNDSKLPGRQNAMDYLQKEGVQFPPGAFAQYTPAGSRLIVRNTPDAIDFIDSLVDAAVGVQPTQVEIESKFLEISQNNLSELGFDWLLGPFAIGSSGVYGAGGTRGGSGTLTDSYYSNFPFGSTGVNPITSGNRSGVGTSVNSAVTANSIDALIAGVPQGTNVMSPGIFGLAGIFSNPQFQMVIRALNQKKGIDLMSAPKVVAKSGRKAVVRVAREFPYPTEFNPPEIPQTQNSSSSTSLTSSTGIIATSGVVTPTTPTAFEKRDLGVTLEVLPQIGPDGYTIDLDLSPEVVEFDGFINYGSPITGPTYNSLTATFSTFEVTPNVINQPIFSTRKVTTSVSIWDGQTVSLGGLIREDVQKVQDKVPIVGDVPIVGRLFRSNVDQKIKRNLIIFVTARLLDAEGKPLRQDFEEDEVVEPLGLPEDLPAPNIEFGKSFGK